MRARHVFFAIALSIGTSAPLAAQAANQNADSAVGQVPPASLAPYAANARAGVSEPSHAPEPFALPPRAHTNNNVTLMIVGGAMFVIGAVVGGTGGTLVMVGGVVVGAIGLVRYLQ